MTRDFVLGGILLALSGTYYALAAAIPDSQLSDAVGPGGLPRAYALLLGVLSLLLMARAWTGRVRLRPISGVARAETVPYAAARVGGMLAIGVVYVAVVAWVGYVVALAGVIIGTACCQGRRLDRRVLLVGAGGAGVLWLLFVRLLGIPQPAGIWSSLW